MMTSLYFVIPLALLLAFGFVVAFLKAVNDGQFDDLETPAHRVLVDENVSTRKDSP